MLLTKLVQAREGSRLASMGTLVVQLTVVFEIYIYHDDADDIDGDEDYHIYELERKFKN